MTKREKSKGRVAPHKKGRKEAKQINDKKTNKTIKTKEQGVKNTRQKKQQRPHKKKWVQPAASETGFLNDDKVADLNPFFVTQPVAKLH